MCRYATAYKPHYACFQCRKTFKRKLLSDIDREKHWQDSLPSKCPECGELMANMGLDFEAPKKNNIKAWEHMSNLYQSGVTFHSCGCSGPGYIPKDTEKLIEYLNERKAEYIEQRRFWLNRVEPILKRDRHIEYEKYSSYFWQLPSQLKEKGRTVKVKNQQAIEYWSNRINDIEEKINNLNPQL